MGKKKTPKQNHRNNVQVRRDQIHRRVLQWLGHQPLGGWDDTNHHRVYASSQIVVSTTNVFSKWRMWWQSFASRLLMPVSWERGEISNVTLLSVRRASDLITAAWNGNRLHCHLMWLTVFFKCIFSVNSNSRLWVTRRFRRYVSFPLHKR